MPSSRTRPPVGEQAEEVGCADGVCAVCVAGVLTERTNRHRLAYLPGGDLEIRWDEPTNHHLVTGPAVEVFTGDWPD